MLIDVKLVSGFAKTLTYKVPADWPALEINMLIRVPVRTARILALIVKIYPETKQSAFLIREALEIEPFPTDQNYFSFLQQLGSYYQVQPAYFIKRMHVFLKEKAVNHPLTVPDTQQDKIFQEVTLTDEQRAIVESLSQPITKPCYYPAVLHGVTGSGKTEIYKSLIMQTFSQNKTTIFLLPEVSLALQFEKILRQQLPSHIPIFAFHSGTTPKQKKLLWDHLFTKNSALIIGVHLPILLPIPHLGLIIIDEEHEVGFQEKKHPKLNTKQVALLRAHKENIPIILGSATPSVSSLYNVQHRGWHFFELKKRFAGNFPTIQTVSLTDKKQRQNFWISDPLRQALKERLIKKEQSIIFLNRRGVCFFIQCKACSFIFSCNACSVSLTLHSDHTLRCHYCTYSICYPTQCLKCKESEFLKKGIGTEQIVTILQKMLPTARIGRADLDITSNKNVWKETVRAFENKELDILVGTQTITKGYHFPNVTLVGIIWADINLNFPYYNACEATLQQLIQVAGRAGRQQTESLVIIQTMTDHPIFKYLNEIDYLQFYDDEIKKRELIGYPPFIRLAEIEIKHSQESIAEDNALHITAQLMQQKNIRVLGPAKPPVACIKKIFSRKIYLKSDSFKVLQNAYASLNQKLYKSSLFFTPDPLN